MTAQVIMSLLCIAAVLAIIVFVQFRLLKSKNKKIDELSRTLKKQWKSRKQNARLKKNSSVPAQTRRNSPAQ